MNDNLFDVMLDINDPQFAEKLREAIGASPSEVVEVVTPTFNRQDGLQVPTPICDFSRLHELSVETLKQIGCQKWDKPNKDGNTLWLYPAEWYDHIPDGTPIVDIFGNAEVFKRGETDDDKRFGALAYGFFRKEDGNV